MTSLSSLDDTTLLVLYRAKPIFPESNKLGITYTSFKAELSALVISYCDVVFDWRLAESFGFTPIFAIPTVCYVPPLFSF